MCDICVSTSIPSPLRYFLLGIAQVSALGRVAAAYYVSYKSMATYNEFLKPTMSDIEVHALPAPTTTYPAWLT